MGADIEPTRGQLTLHKIAPQKLGIKKESLEYKF